MKRKDFWLLAPVILLLFVALVLGFKERVKRNARLRLEKTVVGNWKNTQSDGFVIVLKFDGKGNADVLRRSVSGKRRGFSMTYKVVDATHIRVQDKASPDKLTWKVETIENQIAITADPELPAAQFQRVMERR